MEEVIQITTTADNKETVERIGMSLVEKKLAACIQILGPIKSVYRWKGNVENAEEWLCLIKSKTSLYKEIETDILRLHPYELPEITVTDVIGGLAGYIRWVEDETR
ncbi:MAG: divalent-cation tolerance protein CutA [Syntrophobacterales bacterium]|jgi:periplasmic divalent cation tolerance protein|nr:divalent-cation tolerance protein CutA [Syntrophobacterales bacterium]